MTVAEIHAAALKRLREAGWDDDEARGAARMLADESAGARFSHLAQPERALDESVLARWGENLEKVAAGVPLPYVLGRREFCGLEMICDERALIPRPETEMLVESAIEKLRDHPAPQIADFGTGSGAIAVSVAHALPRARLFATDASAAALGLARANAEKFGVAGRITFLRGAMGDWAAPLRGERCDAILVNPPYVARVAIATLQTQVKDFEPLRALDGGADGLDAYRQLAAQCDEILAPDGFMLAEIGAGQFDAARAIFAAHGWHVGAPLFDLQGIARVLEAKKVAQASSL